MRNREIHTMQPEWQKRVITEEREMSARRDRLAEFINGPKFNDVDLDERIRLHRQLSIMNQYVDVLEQRIEAWPK